MIYRIEVRNQPGLTDARGESLRRQAAALDIPQIEGIQVSDLYFLGGDLSAEDVAGLTDALLCDPVVQQAAWTALDDAEDTTVSTGDGWQVEVAPLPGVTDSVAENLLAAARMVGLAGLTQAATGHRYTIIGALSDEEARRLATGLLANEVIQAYAINRPIEPPFLTPQPVDATVETIPLARASDAELEVISKTRRLSLDLAEMRAIQAYYRGEAREPTDVELEMLAQTWSEHCVHKTFKALIHYQELGADGAPAPGTARDIDSLLKTYIRAATETVAKPWVRSAFVDNAGIVAFDGYYDLAFKAETHNHPSALEPFGGANTGVGGVIRDIIGVSARPIANTDVLCFGPPDLSHETLPEGVLHPRRIADGVTAGVEDYGNKMGIPTVNGAILYDPGYTANPLVFCGCLGILPHGAHRNTPQLGDLVVVIGGRTGRDGLRGATFSSMEMDHETGQIAGSAVQIGHPIHEKQALEACMLARDAELYTAITDCGAGGLSSAIGEMAAELGAEIHLERVPLKYSGLRPWEIWLSEAQERMVLAVPETEWAALQRICAALDTEATALGRFTGDGRLTLRNNGRVVGEIATAFLHGGIPRRELRAEWQRPALSKQDVQPATFTESDLLALLALPDIRSKEDVVRRYDHEVQGGTVVKPFTGVQAAGPGDAAVLDLRWWQPDGRPTEQPQPGVVLACGVNPQYGALDPYRMAWAAVDEAFRNCVAVGADPDRISLLDNFCWGNPNLPDRLGSLVRCAEGCHDAAVAYGAPFVSGKDSLNNEYVGSDGRKHAIPGTLLISALGILPDVHRTVTMDTKAAGDRLYLVGLTANEMGGSAHYRLHGTVGGEAPAPPTQGIEVYRRLHVAMRAELVRACHDCSEGGIAVAAAEMALAGRLGVELDLRRIPHTPDAAHDTALAFSESLGRFIVAVRETDAAAFEAQMAGLHCAAAGRVRSDDRFIVTGLAGTAVMDTRLDALGTAWRGHLRLS
jgi:phosphoribosylformylglycinamidine synthase